MAYASVKRPPEDAPCADRESGWTDLEHESEAACSRWSAALSFLGGEHAVIVPILSRYSVTQ